MSLGTALKYSGLIKTIFFLFKFDKFDEDKDGKLSFEEFLSIFSSFAKEDSKDDE